MKKLGFLGFLTLASLRLEAAPIEAIDERGVKVSLPQCPQRIASLALGVDEILWDLLPPTERGRWIVATTFAKDKTYSNISEVVSQHKNLAFAESPESVMRHNPDLVIAANYIRPEFIHLLTKKGAPVFVLKDFRDFNTIIAQIRSIGRLVCADKAAEALTWEMNQRLKKVGLHKPAKRKKVMNYSAEYLLFGQDTLFNAIVESAQLENLAKTSGIKGWQTVNPERVARMRPEAIVSFSLSEKDFDSPGWRQMFKSAKPKIIDVPQRVLLATSHHAVEAVEILHKALYE